jgi:hypothetical protein
LEAGLKLPMALIILIFSSLMAVQERDWMDWPKDDIPGTEVLPTLSVDEIEGYSISVTYSLDGGRFGDQLTNYLRALWISQKYQFPFLYRPFDYCDQLLLSDFHTDFFNEQAIDSFSAKVEHLDYLDLEKASKMFKTLDHPKKSHGKKLLWPIGLLTPFIEEHFGEKLDDEEFRAFAQKLVKPKKELTLVSLPEGYRCIAVHVRTGVGYDWEINIRNMPTKFPPDTFYLSALKLIADHFPQDALYVHIFTDHPDPGIIRERFFKELKNWGIDNPVTINCRVSGNHHSSNVLEDIFSMMQFDSLIHPDSSISRLVAIIMAPSLEVKPSNWSEYRKDQEGNPILDKSGYRIVDPLIVKRIKQGKPIRSMSVVPIDSSRLF